MFRAVLCTTVVHNNTHARVNSFLNLHVGLGLDFLFVCMFTSGIVCV